MRAQGCPLAWTYSSVARALNDDVHNRRFPYLCVIGRSRPTLSTTHNGWCSRSRSDSAALMLRRHALLYRNQPKLEPATVIVQVIKAGDGLTAHVEAPLHLQSA